jgi:hypothetical protein
VSGDEKRVSQVRWAAMPAAVIFDPSTSHSIYFEVVKLVRGYNTRRASVGWLRNQTARVGPVDHSSSRVADWKDRALEGFLESFRLFGRSELEPDRHPCRHVPLYHAPHDRNWLFAISNPGRGIGGKTGCLVFDQISSSPHRHSRLYLPSDCSRGDRVFPTL